MTAITTTTAAAAIIPPPGLYKLEAKKLILGDINIAKFLLNYIDFA